MTAIVALDTETTGLGIDDHIWEIAAIRRDEDGQEKVLHLFVEHDVEKITALPERFRLDHADRYDPVMSWLPKSAVRTLARFVGDGAHVIGLNPRFDIERLERWDAADMRSLSAPRRT